MKKYIVYDKKTKEVLIASKVKTEVTPASKLSNSELVDITEFSNVPEDLFTDYDKYIFNDITKEFFINISKFRALKLEKIKKRMQEISEQGMCSKVIHRKVDCKRVDLDNLRNLYEFAKANQLSTVTLRLYDNSFREVTLDELDQIIKEIIQYGLQLYQTKWQLEQQIQQATTLEELDAILWPDIDESDCEENLDLENNTSSANSTISN